MARELIALVCRHGDTDLNDQNVFRSTFDPPLNDNGIAAAEKISKQIVKKYNVREVVCSPMLRTTQTADIIAEYSKIRVRQDRGLMPWPLGFLAGKDKKLFDPVLNFFIDNPKITPPFGLSLDGFEARIEEFFEAELNADYRDAESGTSCSAYAEDGPYHCEDCIHKAGEGSPFCLHPVVVHDPKLSLRRRELNGKDVVRIDLKKGCCRYVRPSEGKRTIVVFVTHTSVIVAMENLFHGNRNGRPETGKEALKPGGYGEIWRDGEEYELVPVEGEKEAKFGE